MVPSPIPFIIDVLFIVPIGESFMSKPPPTSTEEVTSLGGHHHGELVLDDNDDVVIELEVALTEVRSLKQPPLAVRRVLSSCFVILSCASGGTSTSTEVSTSNLRKSSRVKLPSWTTCQTNMEIPMCFASSLT